MRRKYDGSNVGEVLGAMRAIEEEIGEYSLRLGAHAEFRLINQEGVVVRIEQAGKKRCDESEP